MPRVSVIMPVYNAKKYIEQAIMSILNQTYQDFELILINDCGNDGSMEVVSHIADTRIKIIKNERNLGISSSRNAGLRNSVGEYIAFLDDDDVSLSGRLEKEIDFLDHHPDITVVLGNAQIMSEFDELTDDYFYAYQNPLYNKALFMFGDPIPNNTTMVRHDFLAANNIWFSDGYLGMEDYKFWLDCSLHGARFSAINEILSYWRIHKENETSKIKANKSHMREKRFSDIRRQAFQGYGFVMTEKDMAIISRIYPEYPIRGRIDNEAELIALYSAFKSIITQADSMKCDNLSEIKSICRRLFFDRIEGSYLWK